MHILLLYFAGIVVGAWPCRTIVMMGELFGSESKSQVYGHTHIFLQRNHAGTRNLRELLFSSNVRP